MSRLSQSGLIATSKVACRAGGVTRTVLDHSAGYSIMHTFEQSGLGKAPFKVIHPADAPADQVSGVFWCEHCGTVIKNRHFVRSANGKVSVVGVDCLKKTGDEGLIAGEKRIRHKIRGEARLAKWAAAEAERVAAEIAKNGKSNAELAAEVEAEMERFKAEFALTLDDDAFVQSLKGDGFESAMQQQAYQVEAYTPGQLGVLKKIRAKQLSGGARAGSKKFNDALPLADAEVDALQARLDQAALVLFQMKEKRFSYRNG